MKLGLTKRCLDIKKTPMDKKDILQEIKRTARENSGVPLGRRRFETETGIRESDWYGKYWSKWGDAVLEAGFVPREKQVAYSDEMIIGALIKAIRYFQKWPINSELRLYARQNSGFPSHNIFNRIGNKDLRIKCVREHCEKNFDEFEDVLDICKSLKSSKISKRRTVQSRVRDDHVEGFVYLMKSGKFYKIGRSVCAEKRHHELKILLPEKLKLVHKIKTDDPNGIEAYWHRRYAEKRKNGEWFELNSEDVKAFKRRKYM